jgi:hypothetical protein
MPVLSAGAPLGEVAEILHAATVLGPAAWGTFPFPEAHLEPGIEDRLRKDLLELFGLLHSRHISYLLVGGVAMLTYVEGRNTKDVDLVLSLQSLQQLPEVSLSDQNREFARGLFGNFRVDVLLTTNPLFGLVQETYATIHQFLEIDVRCATVEGLILLKLYALPSLYKVGDGQRIGLYENDVFMLCERYRPNIEPLFATLATYLDDGQMRELQNIMDDIQRRIARIDRAKNKA